MRFRLWHGQALFNEASCNASMREVCRHTVIASLGEDGPRVLLVQLLNQSNSTQVISQGGLDQRQCER